ncbi:MAG: ATP-dependent DNA helicase RecG [Mariprofundus sp.]|nr:ATP-dependent DNA helicase RecG [Mariprofundus sp.]
MYDFFAQSIAIVPGIGPALQKRLLARDIHCLGDLLLHLPKDYIDDRQITPIDQLIEHHSARIQGRIVSRQARGFGRSKQVSLHIADDTGQVALNFFHSGYMMNDARLGEGREISVRGTLESWKGHKQMPHPDWCLPEQFRPGFQPQYSSLAGLSSKRLTSFIQHILTRMPASLSSPLDVSLQAVHLPSLSQALQHIHQPHDIARQQLQTAVSRLKSEEMIIYLRLMQEKKKAADCPAVSLQDEQLSHQLLANFPFPLTPAQQSAWQDITADLHSGKRMHRLLQGDVGSGKTWIAALAMVKAAACGYQAALLAPTEVLANQHAETLQTLFTPLGLNIALLTGSCKAKARREILAGLVSGEINLIVGTHALLTDDVVFKHLALALVDEQHRFGVRQRWGLADKKQQGTAAVHLLGMTATPIPRSLALSLYSDMDLSIMRGMPPGRKAVETRVIAAAKMKALADGMQRILNDQGRIYWIVPRIDEDEDGVSVDQRAELLSSHFPKAVVMGLHGRMKSKAKQAALDAFSNGACNILVSTTVVEVGVNVVEARLIVIEQAESYGLAQLHQLRGRVGRSHEQGYCILIAGDQASQTANERLKQLVNTHDGLTLAEADLALRGSGDAIGTRQHGDAGFRLLNMADDAPLMRQYFECLPEFSSNEAMQQFWRPCAESTD